MTQIAIFSHKSIDTLRYRVNEWLRNAQYVTSVLSCTLSHDGFLHYVTLLYVEKED